MDTAGKRSNSTYYNAHGHNTILTTPKQVCLVSAPNQCTCYALPSQTLTAGGGSKDDELLLPLPEPVTNASFQAFEAMEGTETYGELTVKRLRLSVLTIKPPRAVVSKTDLTDEFDVSALLDVTTGLPLVVNFYNESSGIAGQPARTEHYRDMRVGPLDAALFEVPAFCALAPAHRNDEVLQVLMNRVHYKPFAATVNAEKSNEEDDEEKAAGATAAATLTVPASTPLPPSSGSSDSVATPSFRASAATPSGSSTGKGAKDKDPVDVNLDLIKQHNKKPTTPYQLTANRFLHVRPQAFFQRYALRAATPEEEAAELASYPTYQPSPTQAAAILPPSLDRREEGKVTPVRDQGVCLSSYAHAAVAALETNVAVGGGALERLSVQSLIDCVAPGDGAVTCKGCNGGWPLTALGWVKEEGKGTLPLDDEQPYFAVQGLCATTKSHRPTNALPTATKAAGVPPPSPTDLVLSDLALVPRGDEAALAHAVLEHGSVVVTIEVRDDFLLYGGGVYDNPECTGRSLDHHLMVVGFTEEAWICKNSLGREWGEEGGYVRLARGKNMCGLANWAVVPIVQPLE